MAKLVTLLILFVLIMGTILTVRSVKMSAAPQERHFAVRSAIFFWVMGGLTLIGVLMLPIRLLIVAAIPGTFFIMSALSAWHRVRERIRGESRRDVEWERAKNAKRTN